MATEASLARLLATPVAALFLGSATAVPAAAADEQPCVSDGEYQTLPTGRSVAVERCPDWSPRPDGRIPVYESPHGGTAVGWLDETGPRANWYVCQVSGARQDLGGYWNTWWALTRSDTGAWGWVNEVHFRGGGNGEADGGLAGDCPRSG
ncbi:hypothetical protein ACQEU5_13760 [Marinactinospora thermotolerans]|uniref:hypothetical protein n=1 Tax=Marinactinospora thermotolerans TaxID=531310 RepID=UPI003D8C0351